MSSAPNLGPCLALLILASACGGGHGRSSPPPDPTCQDEATNGAETDLDCGGPTCAACAPGAACLAARDCESRVCGTDGRCAAPACGDGVVGSGEACDDGGLADGDGCSSGCQREDGWACAGEPSRCQEVCGDAKIVGAEGCDDGNATPDDGCSSTCRLEAGHVCPLLGERCLTVCGDGIVAGLEQCDDGGVAPDDGCGATCRWEAGWACTGTAGAYTCDQTTCGDGTIEGGEACDVGDRVPGDGCSATCGREPRCAPGTACETVCGDGVVEGTETCDDGNLASGDGCSGACAVEAGFTCAAASVERVGGTAIRRLPIVYRDFIDSTISGGHPDFQVGCGSLQTGIVKPLLDPKRLPELLSNSNACISDGVSFAQWFDFSLRGAWGSGPIASELLLWDDGAGGFVNRYGADGSRWGARTVTEYTNGRWCSNASNDCAACGALAAHEVCMGTCTIWGNSQTCAATVTTRNEPGLDGNPLFFPLDSAVLGQKGDVTPLTQYARARIPAEIYGGNWDWESGGALHNFAFTSQARFWFRYDATRTSSIAFTGDDDVWVFVNGTLAIDLGGLHVPTAGTLTLDAAAAGRLGLVHGGVYEVAIFQAERKQTGSSYKLALSGFPPEASACTAVCGDGVVTLGEQCDSGTARNTGGYGRCGPDCTLGERCGDGRVNGAEQCDNGVNTDGADAAGADRCMPGCRLPRG